MNDHEPQAAPVVVDEWRVTGDPGPGYPPYVYVWTDEKPARTFADEMRGWVDGPHLHHRTVTYGPWEAL